MTKTKKLYVWMLPGNEINETSFLSFMYEVHTDNIRLKKEFFLTSDVLMAEKYDSKESAMCVLDECRNFMNRNFLIEQLVLVPLTITYKW